MIDDDAHLYMDASKTILWPARDLRPGMIVVERLGECRVASPVAEVTRDDIAPDLLFLRAEPGHPDLSPVPTDGMVEVVQSEAEGF